MSREQAIAKPPVIRVTRREVWQDVGLVFMRLAIAYCVSWALPYAHMEWGQPYPGEGPNGFISIVAMFAIGACAAIVYIAGATVFHIRFRRRSRCRVAAFDLAVGAVMAVLLAYWGIAVRYTDDGTGPAKPAPSAVGLALPHVGG